MESQCGHTSEGRVLLCRVWKVATAMHCARLLCWRLSSVLRADVEISNDDDVPSSLFLHASTCAERKECHSVLDGSAVKVRQ
jgi:hypothetical protein